MKVSIVVRTVTCLLGLAAGLASSQSPAQDGGGSLRDRIRDWRAQRQAGQAAPQEATDPQATITKAGDYVFSIDDRGNKREYKVHVPAKYDPAKPTPLLVSLHGGGANMDYQASDENYGQISKSDREGFVVVFPNGFSRLPGGKFATWNAGNCCGAARDNNIDDVGFIRRVVENLSHQLNIDPAKIFATGMSNGALFSYRLACEMSDTIKAIAAVAGSDGTRSCDPKTPVSILEIHAKDDEFVLFNGGAGRDSKALADFVSVPETIARWVRRDGCPATPKRVLENAGAYCDSYAPCRGGTEVKLCVTESGGHSWPGGRKVRTGEPGSTAISATDVMWEFFQSH